MAAKKKSVVAEAAEEGIEAADDMPEDAKLSGKEADELREQAEEMAAKAVKGKKGKAAVAVAGTKIVIPPLKIVKTTITVQQMSPLIVHRFGEKAKKQMRDKKMQVATNKREACDPDKEYLESRYVQMIKGKEVDVLPSLAFKNALVDAASFVENVTKVQLRGVVFIEGEFVPIKYADRTMREDVVRVGMGAADLRYRAMYEGWSVELPIQFNPNVISPEQVHHLLQLAGFAIGVFEWRPQKNGQFGRFELKAEADEMPVAAEE